MLFLLILPILNFLDLASFDPLLDVPVGGGGRDAESGGEFLICLAVKGFRESVEESLLACVCKCGGYGFFDLREGAENLVDVDYEDYEDIQIVRAVRKSGSVQVRGEERSPVSRMRRAVKIRIIRKVDRPRRRTDATMYSP